MRDEWSPYGDGEYREKKKRKGKHPTNPISREQLKSIVERIENLETEKSELGDDIKQVYAEAKADGFDTKVLRQVIRLRKKDLAERQEEDALRDLYMQALGMVAGGTA